MNGTRVHRKATSLLFAALAAIPMGSALSSTADAATKTSAKVHTYRGSTVNTTWGAIQVSIAVKGKKITGVAVSDPTHTARSGVIDSQAIPVLKQETLQAQSARINEVSGATTISQAYISSLQSAIKAAHLA